MLYMTLVTITAVILGGSVHVASAHEGCDSFGDVESWHETCYRTLRSNDVPGVSLEEALAGYCSGEQEYIDCMERRVLEENCDNLADIMLVVRKTMGFCENGVVADWISDAPIANEDCAESVYWDVANDCFQDATKQSPYGYRFETATFDVGVVESNRFTDRSFQCIRSTLPPVLKRPLLGDCASTTWQGAYNWFVLKIALLFRLGLQIQECDIVSRNGDDVSVELRRALLPVPWRQRRSA